MREARKQGRGRRVSSWAVVGLALFACLAFLPVVQADARTDYLIRLLETSGTFRVRAQAALSLGRIEGDQAVVTALSTALADDHPAVRTAAAASLERLSDPSALAALRARRRDSDAGVRRAVTRAITTLERVARTQPQSSGTSGSSGSSTNANARFYVGIGVPGTKVAQLDRATLASAQRFIEGQVNSIATVEVAPAGQSRSQVSRTLRRRRLLGYYIDASITSVTTNAQGLRVAVSVIVGTYPGRDMRAMLSGAATVPGGQGESARTMAIEGALRSALRRLPQALQAAEARDGR